jgi:hypothetical protein
MTIDSQVEMTSVQIQIHDWIWILIIKCLIIKKCVWCSESLGFK